MSIRTQPKTQLYQAIHSIFSDYIRDDDETLKEEHRRKAAQKLLQGMADTLSDGREYSVRINYTERDERQEVDGRMKFVWREYKAICQLLLVHGRECKIGEYTTERFNGYRDGTAVLYQPELSGLRWSYTGPVDESAPVVRIKEMHFRRVEFRDSARDFTAWRCVKIIHPDGRAEAVDE